MPLLETLASIFIDTFGITRPTPQNRHRAALFIAGMLVLVGIFVGIGAAFLYRIIRG
jgi:hypothetical protein